MTSLASLEGRALPSAEPFELGREHLRQFAVTVGVTGDVYTDPDAARAAGFADIVAPPTFAAVVAQRSEWLLWGDPEIGIDFHRVVHGEERIAQTRPLVAGDVLTSKITCERVREMRGNTMLTTRVDLTDAAGDQVAQVWSMIVIRADEREQGGQSEQGGQDEQQGAQA